MASLEDRVKAAAQAILQQQHFVCAADIFSAIGWIHPTNVDAWRKGHLRYFFEVVSVRWGTVVQALEILLQWASDNGLRATEGRYVRTTYKGAEELKFTADGDPEFERMLRVHFVSPDLPAAKVRKLEEKQKAGPRRVVFEIIRDSKCSECGIEIDKGDLLWMEKDQALCLACAGWSDMEYLPSGDVALTRRATKYSTRSAVIVRFSRSRGRYERQGILVEPSAIERAERECTEDASERAKARAKGALTRKKDDARLIEQMTSRILDLFPSCPSKEAEAIAVHTAERGSGRVGRSAAGRSLDEDALILAVRASIRHRHTAYDSMLASGLEREDARAAVIATVDALAKEWQRK